jgi:MtrB/PioB family decaheme-associated outer membrane protein
MQSHYARSCLALAVGLALPSESALADDAAAQGSPNIKSVSVTVGDLSQVNPLYRYYTGIDHSGIFGILDLDIVNRDAAGEWLRITGQNLGLSGIQEFGATAEKQGDWRLALDYNEITKYAPYTIQTKVGGVGSADLSLNSDFRSSGGLGGVSSLDLERKGTSLSGTKFFGDTLKANFSVNFEEKSGEIMSSSDGNNLIGLTPANSGVPVAGKTYATQFFAPQPEDYKHTQVEASLDYFTSKWQVTGGYYGSFFVDNNSALNIVPGTDPSQTTNYLSSQVPWISLPPSNHAQQLYAQGAYNLSDTSRLTFKATNEQLVQDMGFIPQIVVGGVNPKGVVYAPGISNANLGGAVTTTSYATKFTSRLATGLDFVASWRYENRDDETPIRPYIVSGGVATFNAPDSHTSNDGKVELTYRLPDDYRISGGFNYQEQITPGQLRQLVEDDIFHIDLKKSMSETVNGTFTVLQDTRTGGPWTLAPVDPSPTCACFPTATNVTAPIEFGDRTRDAARLMVDWSPIAPLSLQFYYEIGFDKYTSSPFGQSQVPDYSLAPTGLLSGRSNSVGIDAAYAINAKWKLTAYVSYNDERSNQDEVQTPRIGGIQTCAGGGTIGVDTTCVPWSADLDMRGTTLGASLRGKISVWNVGASYTYEKDLTNYAISYVDPGVLSPVPAGAGNLPKTFYTINSLQLTAGRALDKNTRVRFDYVYDVRNMDDYTWQNWTFSDGTTVFQSPHQVTQLIKVTLTVLF